MDKGYFPTRRTARYYAYGDISTATELWIALHGHGQQAKYFARNLDPLQADNVFLVVPEAMNRYYLEGYSGRVGATWMTSDDRLKDIEDNHDFLESLTDHFFTLGKRLTAVNLLAFSQGIATACRWMSVSKHHFSRAVLWAGSLPPDLDWANSSSLFKRTDLSYVFGNEDEFFDEEKIRQNSSFLEKNGIPFQLVKFEGKHDLDRNTLEDILK